MLAQNEYNLQGPSCSGDKVAPDEAFKNWFLHTSDYVCIVPVNITMGVAPLEDIPPHT